MAMMFSNNPVISYNVLITPDMNAFKGFYAYVLFEDFTVFKNTIPISMRALFHSWCKEQFGYAAHPKDARWIMSLVMNQISFRNRDDYLVFILAWQGKSQEEIIANYS